jgi:hypothetical protein
MNADRVKGTAVGGIGGILLAVGLMFGAKGCPAPSPTNPDDVAIAKTGQHVVVIVDDSSLNIPQALVIDGPLMRALKLEGKCSICSMTEEWTKTKGYDTLLSKAGGAPAMIVLDAEGKCNYCARLPTDQKALEERLKKSMVSLPAPLAPITGERVVSAGEDIRVQSDAAGNQFVVTDGHKRMLAAKPAPVKFAALPSYAASNPVFPVNEWYDLSRRNVFGSPDWIEDQDGLNSCVGNGGVRTLRVIRALAGMKDVRLSPGFLYAHINGNRDEGAMIPDVIPALKKFGTCSFELMGQKPIYVSQLRPDAKTDAARFTLVDAYRCNTWEETVSALLTGRYAACFGIMVGNSFYRFDQYGVCGHTNGPGNHCVMADGVKKLADGRWVLDVANSWGYNFGPWKNGRVYMDKQHLFGGGDQPSVVVMRLASRDPKDAYDPPALKP